MGGLRDFSYSYYEQCTMHYFSGMMPMGDYPVVGDVSWPNKASGLFVNWGTKIQRKRRSKRKSRSKSKVCQTAFRYLQKCGNGE